MLAHSPPGISVFKAWFQALSMFPRSRTRFLTHFYLTGNCLERSFVSTPVWSAPTTILGFWTRKQNYFDQYSLFIQLKHFNCTFIELAMDFPANNWVTFISFYFHTDHRGNLIFFSSFLRTFFFHECSFPSFRVRYYVVIHFVYCILYGASKSKHFNVKRKISTKHPSKLRYLWLRFLGGQLNFPI